MAKKHRGQRQRTESVREPEPEAPVAREESFETTTEGPPAIPETATGEAPTPEVEVRELDLPVLATAPTGYRARHLSVNLSPEEATSFRRLTMGLSFSGARLDNGRPVETVADAARYVAQKIGGGE